ncbi:GPI ethanolamine phosphate transferase 2-like isoform X1 [Achlya hypogyna]|uniref:GPI ethanolamine phosphate transferase 2-like isoform X1 n=1 Tax=Achlya hypogyna TaxID=1202772 RepID=A0A1V9YKV2_ACHHY|nr:GPI ethanolamine phosphate transferase 2-like isoform X1 [Achlya hypogyna]
MSREAVLALSHPAVGKKYSANVAKHRHEKIVKAVEAVLHQRDATREQADSDIESQAMYGAAHSDPVAQREGHRQMIFAKLTQLDEVEEQRTAGLQAEVLPPVMQAYVAARFIASARMETQRFPGVAGVNGVARLLANDCSVVAKVAELVWLLQRTREAHASWLQQLLSPMWALGPLEGASLHRVWGQLLEGLEVALLPGRDYVDALQGTVGRCWGALCAAQLSTQSQIAGVASNIKLKRTGVQLNELDVCARYEQALCDDDARLRQLEAAEMEASAEATLGQRDHLVLLDWRELVMSSTSLAAVCVVAVAAALLSASGLFGLNFSVAHSHDAPPVAPAAAAIPAVFDRLVFVVIDALRADMVLGNDAVQHSKDAEELRGFMPFTAQLASSPQSIAYIGHAAVPTVTMPRLKALTTGKKPAFIDVLRNFNSKALDEDNLVAQLSAAGRKMVLYGDETWLLLFPEAFCRADPTSGFFTKDTVEVDTNVTRHLREELDPTNQSPKSRDWDALFLHYLGVDHVGHLTGPHSPLMRTKLAEMDDTIQAIHAAIAAQDAARGTATLLLLLSDHGMTETGNHGGASVEESSALLLFVLPQAMATAPAPFARRPQVDVVPTLAALLGVPIPTQNMGRVLSRVIDAAAPAAARLAARYANLRQLRRLAQPKHSAMFWAAFDNEHAAALAWTPASDLPPALATTLIEAALDALQGIVLRSDGSEYNTVHLLLAIAAGTGGLVGVCRVDRLIRAAWRAPSLPAATVAGAALLQIAALASSSAIENEHALWNLLLTSHLAVVAVAAVGRRSGRAVWVPWVIVLVAARVLRCRNQIINFGRLNGFSVAAGDSRAGLEYEHDDNLSVLSTRSLVHGLLPPLAERVVASAVVVAAECWRDRSRLHVASFAAGMLATVLFSAVPIDTVAHVAYVCAGLQACLAVGRRRHALSAVWLLAFLLQRDTNVAALAVLYAQLEAAAALRRALEEPLLTVPLAVYLAKASFFALGNSHLMTTIDISKAYTGLSAYSQSIVGGLTAFIVFTGPLLVLLAQLDASKDKHALLLGCWCLELGGFTVYSAVVYFMRFHLFIWSVFAPKVGIS